jgi:oligoribonuclease NrnB/cAMP/cGMP phosphodiesterase (DHH superfamily)
MTDKKPLVVYHANCTDGFGAALAAYLKLGDTVEYYPMQYGYTSLPDFEDREVYLFDFSWKPQDMEQLFMFSRNLVWLDHHKTAFEMYDKSTAEIWEERTLSCYTLLDNSKSGAMLAWEYFFPQTTPPDLFRFIQDRDLWRFKYPETKDIIAGIRSYPMEFGVWEYFLESRCLDSLKYAGVAINRYLDGVYKSLSKGLRTITVNGVEGVIVNAPGNFASDLAEFIVKDSFVVVWYENAKGMIVCSVRSQEGSVLTANEVATQFGGGGHAHASGFSITRQQFMELEIGTIQEN